MSIEWTGDAMVDTQTFAREVFEKIREPSEELLAILLFWHDAKLTHTEALDDRHFISDAAKSNLYERVIPRLARERKPSVLSLAVHTHWMSAEGRREGVLVTVVGADFVRMTRALVERRPHAPPVLGPFEPFPRLPEQSVKSWINDALMAAVRDAEGRAG